MEKRSPNNRKWIWYCLIFVDLVGISTGFLAVYWILILSGWIQYHRETPFEAYITLYVCSVPFFLLIFRGCGLYDRHEIFYGTNEYIKIIKACTVFVLGLVVLGFGINCPPPSNAGILAVWILTIWAVSLGRFIFRRLIRWKNGAPLERALFLGANEEAKAIAKRLQQNKMVEVVGFLDEFSPQNEEVWNRKRILGPPSQYIEIAHNQGVTLVVLVPDAVGWETQREVLKKAASQRDIEVQIAPGFNELYSVSMRVIFKGDVPLLQFRPGYANGLDAILKTAMDYTLGTLILLAMGPVILVLGLMLWLQGTKPIIESFEVLGKNGRTFRTLKFQSGLNGPTGHRSFRKRVKLDVDQDSLNSTGKFLFRTALDKLPQLFNVMTGSMSLVGPRVVPLGLAKQYGPSLPGLLAVKPGMTGTWAFCEGQELEHEISLTLYYVRNWSIWQDLAILLKTAFEIIRTRFRTRPLQSAEPLEMNKHSPPASLEAQRSQRR